MFGWIIFITILSIWFLILYYLNRRGFFVPRDGVSCGKCGKSVPVDETVCPVCSEPAPKRKLSMSLYGPFIMWRTQGGKKFLEKLAGPKRFWRGMGNFAFVLVLLVMISMTFFLVWSATFVAQIPEGKAPTPQMMLGIPGINPLIPLWYGIFALAVAIIVHEFSHGIMTRAEGIKVRSLGLLFFILPVGAFVEPDEEEVRNAKRSKRTRLYAAGPASNIIFAVICALIFSWSFMGSVSPVHDGVVVRSTLVGSPGDSWDLTPGTAIFAIDDVSITSKSDWDSLIDADPGQRVNITVLYDGEERIIDGVPYGLVITTTLMDYPANRSGISSGMILYSIDGNLIREADDISSALDDKSSQTINITMIVTSSNGEWSDFKNFSVTPVDKYDYYSKYASSLNKEEYRGDGFIGINYGIFGLYVEGINELPNRLHHPLAGPKDAATLFGNGINFISLPFRDLAPLRSPLTDLYEPTGLWSAVPAPAFWILANIFYWLFWLNLMVGLTNALPMLPLDGGFIEGDIVYKIVGKVKKGASVEEKEMIARSITYTTALLIFALIIWQLIGPRIL